MRVKLFPIWKNKTVVCVAGGPSLDDKMSLGYMRNIYSPGNNSKIIAVNDAYKLIPDADILYACDSQWWEWHKGAPDFKGYKLQHGYFPTYQDKTKKSEPYPGIDYITSDGTSGFSEDMENIRTGGNSGYQAVHIAMQLGAKEVILFGYDMKATEEKSHWFGEHPNGRGCNSRYERWIKEFEILAPIAKKKGINIYNASKNSALTCFKKI